LDDFCDKHNRVVRSHGFIKNQNQNLPELSKIGATKKQLFFKAVFLNKLTLSFLPSSIVLTLPLGCAPHPKYLPLLDIGVLPADEFLYNARQILSDYAREFF
jgi:hypothetical protein